MSRQQRLTRELEKIKSTTTNGIFVNAEDLNKWSVQILGPNNSPYENGVFDLEITIPNNYPFSPPALRFLTKIYHPNIDENGRICMDLLKMPPSGSWRPTIGIEGLLIAVKMLLENPNPNDPLMACIAKLYIQNKEAFNQKAEEYTLKYASSKIK